MSNNSIEAVLQESRRFAVPSDFHGKLDLETFNRSDERRVGKEC